MIHDTWLDNAVEVSSSSGVTGVTLSQTISAAVSDDSTLLVVRVVNISGRQV
jgi:hypothetical protein